MIVSVQEAITSMFLARRILRVIEGKFYSIIKFSNLASMTTQYGALSIWLAFLALINDAEES